MFMSDEIQKNTSTARESMLGADSETLAREGFVRSEDS